ncbi:MAG: hypothetical protein H8E79_07535 [Desulfobulbaceae bacterium]|uniref:Uncharacterized protein n=1 Tax=Candidatus Desulfatifera sulfidica TaxID=2841691 RepID=A0A8J6TE12_9BACT|nr:hypothetical protein [Candidatus Desulfatifera sulfidica]
MKTYTQTEQQSNTDIAHENSQFALGTGIVASALVGLWGFSCMIGALMSSGFGETIQGFINALTGM